MSYNGSNVEMNTMLKTVKKKKNEMLSRYTWILIAVMMGPNS